MGGKAIGEEGKPAKDAPALSSTWRRVARVAGALVLLLVLVPIYRLAPAAPPGSPAEHLTALAASYYGALVFGVVVVSLLALPFAFTTLPRRVGAVVGRGGARLLLGSSPPVFALVLGLAAGCATLLLSAHAFGLQPALVDAISQLVHARYLANGHLAAPLLAGMEFFTFQYMVAVPEGWVSQYPPGHVALLAVGYRLGAIWLVGPMLVAATVFLTARLAELLLPDDPLAGRVGTVFLAGSLFFLGHAAGYMSHAAAAAFMVAAIHAVLRGRGPGPRQGLWLFASGIATGATFAVRPLAGLIAAAVALGALLATGTRSREGFSRRVAWYLAGGVPPAAAVGAYNWHLFGSPTRFGYIAAEGPGHGLGFHQDPWGNPYGPVDGLIQTSRDLLALGMDLLVTPVSITLVIGIYLLFGPNRLRADPLLFAWAFLPLVANFFYWHQDLFLGPRLLTEFVPPWALLAGMSVVGMARWAGGDRNATRPRFDAGGWVVAALIFTALGAATLLIPQRVALYASQWGDAVRTPIPSVPQPSLVFVQGSWSERLGGRLAGHGLRVDSIRAALRFNTSCEVQEALDAAERIPAADPPPAGSTGPAGGPLAEVVRPLYFRPRIGVDIHPVVLTPTVRISSHGAEELTFACLRQANADRLGALSLPELFWQGDLPGLEGQAAMFARDLGPELNDRLIALHPNRRPIVYLRTDPGRPPLLLPYAEGMGLLWDAAPAAGVPSMITSRDSAGP